MGLEFIALPQLLLQRIDIVWTFLLLIVRFTGVFMNCPGIGMGVSGITVRFPAIMVFAFAAVLGSPTAVMPANTVLAVGMMFSELLFGALLGLLPQLAIAGIQAAAGICSTSMGLQASQLIDPTLQVSVPDIARIFGDLAVLIFISLGGHYAVVYAAAGMGGVIVPGSFVASDRIIELLVNHTAQVFEIGVLFSAPVVVALLITNVVLGIVSKAVPTVNVFMVSFPLTIAIGLVLSIFLVSELPRFLEPWLSRVGDSMDMIVKEGTVAANRAVP